MQLKMFLKIIISVCALVLGVNSDECDKSDCTTTLRHYKELDCTPVVDKGKCCPKRFLCPNFAERQSRNCYFKGESYELQQVISDTKTSRLCLTGCRCLQSNLNSNILDFYCAEIMCPIIFHSNFYPCVGVGNINSCCATKYICDEDDINNLGTCIKDGRKYFVGQRIFQKKPPCHTCYCGKDFVNSTAIENEYCEEIECGIGLKLMEKVIRGCIPVYSSYRPCCPIYWKCPDASDIIIKNNLPVDNKDPNMVCVYGEIILELGDGITDRNQYVDCKCLVPPMVHCIEFDD